MTDVLVAGGLEADDPTRVVAVLLGATAHPLLTVDPATGRVDYRRPAGATGAHTFDGDVHADTAVLGTNGIPTWAVVGHAGAAGGASNAFFGMNAAGDVAINATAGRTGSLRAGNTTLLSWTASGVRVATGFAAWGGTPPSSKPAFTGPLASATTVAELRAVLLQVVHALDGASLGADATT